ncbi:hypothetical protein NIES4075_13040 [Tolypothrix sp. NIES-4075]|nr:hypothetical protein NIES4075_13040 [Tolypothrix sp. NIES-4075]
MPVFGYFKRQRLRTGKLFVKCMLFNKYLICSSKKYISLYLCGLLYTNLCVV